MNFLFFVPILQTLSKRDLERSWASLEPKVLPCPGSSWG